MGSMLYNYSFVNCHNILLRMVNISTSLILQRGKQEQRKRLTHRQPSSWERTGRRAQEGLPVLRKASLGPGLATEKPEYRSDKGIKNTLSTA